MDPRLVCTSILRYILLVPVLLYHSRLYTIAIQKQAICSILAGAGRYSGEASGNSAILDTELRDVASGWGSFQQPARLVDSRFNLLGCA